MAGEVAQKGWRGAAASRAWILPAPPLRCMPCPPFSVNPLPNSPHVQCLP